jgi:hypothetical protein
MSNPLDFTRARQELRDAETDGQPGSALVFAIVGAIVLALVAAAVVVLL